MRLLYPADPFDPRQVDEMYAEEFAAATDANLASSIFSLEALADGSFRPRPAHQPGEAVLYRGWMMTEKEYRGLSEAVDRGGARMTTTPEQYLACHHLPGWHERCAEFTPQTRVVTADADFDALVRTLGWNAYFVKDYVKSLTTARGSIAHSAAEIREIIALIEKFRGRIEGGICLREVEALNVESEERYFVYRGRVFSRTGDIPALVASVAARIDSPFFAIDIAQRTDGQWRLVEIGDGQVSDRKLWSAGELVAMLST